MSPRLAFHRFALIALGVSFSLTFESSSRVQAQPPPGQTSPTPKRSETPEPIEIADAQVSLIQNTFVAAPIAGIVSRVSVTEGDAVEVGRPMVVLDDAQVRTELQAAMASLEAARMEATNDVDARYAQRTLEVRQRELEQSDDANRSFAGAVSETEIAKQRLVVDQSRLAIEQAEHEMQVAQASAREKEAAATMVKARLEKHTIAAPVSGKVVEIVTEPGEWVEAGKPVVRVISTDPIRVECFIDGNRYGDELVGRPIQFFHTRQDNELHRSKPIPGKVTYVSPELHPVTGQARLWATIDNPDGKARAGMRGRLIISPPPQ